MMQHETDDEGPTYFEMMGFDTQFDPLEEASNNAALRLVQGLPMSAKDWDALKQRSINELQELDRAGV